MVSVFDFTNNYGYDVYTTTVLVPTVLLPSAGTYWLTLQGALDMFNDPIYWDENDGPSAAFDNTIGSLSGGNGACANGQPTCTGSETFDINAPEPTATMPLVLVLLLPGWVLNRKTLLGE